MRGQCEESCLPKAEHLGVSSVSRGGMGGHEESCNRHRGGHQRKICAVPCRVVPCHVVCVLQGSDAKPGDRRALLSQDSLA